jgi:hypothetical protein
MNEKEDYVAAHKKSHVVNLLATFLFGPIGLLYASWVAGLIIILACIFTSGTIVIPLVLWFSSIPIGAACVHDHNRRVETTAGMLSVR